MWQLWEGAEQVHSLRSQALTSRILEAMYVQRTGMQSARAIVNLVPLPVLPDLPLPLQELNDLVDSTKNTEVRLGMAFQCSSYPFATLHPHWHEDLTSS